MEDDLVWLKKLLAEYGGMDRVVAIERAAREQMPPLDTRAELAFLLDELEDILVHGFKVVATTMDMLEAESLHFLSDPGIDENDESITAGPALVDDVNSLISKDTLNAWSNIASEASEILTELRRSYDL